MDPSNIVSIIELSTSALKLGSKVFFEFFGNDRSIEKLQRLNLRLQGLNDILQKIPKSEIPLLKAQYRGIDTTLRECKAFLKDYEATLSSKGGIRSATQRTGFLFSEGRLDSFNKRIDDHFHELNAHIGIRILLDDIATPKLIPSRTGDRDPLIASPEPIFSRRWTGETLTEGMSTSLPNSRPPILEVPLRTLSDVSGLEQLVLPLLEDTGPPSPRSHGTDGDGTSPFLSPSSLLGINGVTRTSGLTSYPSSIAEDAEDVQEDPPGIPEGPPRSENRSIGHQLQPATDGITAVQNGIQGRPLKLVLGPRGHVDLMSDRYLVQETGEYRIVEWTMTGMRLRHSIPRNETRIPYTKPNDKNLEVSFLPRSTRHTFEITDSSGIHKLQEIPRYYFSHKPDRETFQRKVRNRQFLEMVQALVVHSREEKYIAKDVHLKIWRTNAADDSPILSFAHHEKGHGSHHVEYKIRWFRRSPEFKGETRLVLRVYSQESDLEYGPDMEEQPTTRRPSFSGIIMRRNSSRSRSPSVSSRTASVLYEQKGEIPPANVQRLGYLEIEFQTESLRGKFIKACYDVHQPGSTNLARRTTGIFDGQISPRPLSRPPSWSLFTMTGANQSDTAAGFAQ
ncbi:hypothetical protein PG985_007824 [Apiospora marii]|uniref:Fungal N-terminal domain-containing protein n=1 Tax=Apiospora marii TaxID=335849 RepID=A0ABR1SQD9_9PEZI